MRQTKLGSMASLFVLGGWLSLSGTCFGDDSQNGDAKRSPAAAADVAASPSQQKSATPAEQNSQADTDDHVRHHAALGVLLGTSSDGVRIVGVIPGSPAAMAGLRMGDEIRQVGDERIRTTKGLTDEIRKCEPGAQVDLTIRRNGDRRIIKATLASEQTTFQNRYQANRRAPSGDDASSRRAAGRAAGAAAGGDRRLLMLQRQIAQLQQEVARLQANQQSEQSTADDMQSENWGWDGEDNQGHDPALFQ